MWKYTAHVELNNRTTSQALVNQGNAEGANDRWTPILPWFRFRTRNDEALLLGGVSGSVT